VISGITSQIKVGHKRFSAVKIIERDRDYRPLLTDEITAKINALEEMYKMDGEN
jgi:hypothetical protein